MKKWLLRAGSLTAIMLTASSAWALDMEFYTYGGFNPVMQAFLKIALIFSDANYNALFTVFAIGGILIGAISGLSAAFTTGRLLQLGWIAKVITGAVLFIALLVPKGNVTVYDPVMNRFQTIGGVPDGIVAVAGMLNLVERGLVDIIDTAATPGSEYNTNAGGSGFKVLEAVRTSAPKDNYLRTSLVRYVKDCVTFELMRPGTTLSLDDLRNTTTDFLTDLAQAVNPSVFTVYYDATTPSGTSMSCTAAWGNLQPIFAAVTSYDEATRKLCSKALFDASNATELATCKNLLSNTLDFASGTTYTPETIIRQREIAETLYTFYFQDDPEVAALIEANRNITSSGIGLGITMNEWIPIIKAILTAISLGILPFLSLLLPTPALGKALSVMAGFFVFLTTWGVTDALVHSAAMDYAAYSFEGVRQTSLGVYAMAAIPTESTKMLAMFGVIRGAGMMLASLIAGMLIKFGGSMLAHLAGSLTSLVQGVGARAGAMFTPEGRAEMLQRQSHAAGLLEGMREHKFANLAGAEAWQIHKSVGGHGAAMAMKRGMEQTQQIPMGMSNAGFAQAMSSANQSVATRTGSADATVDSDGNILSMTSKSVTAQRFNRSAMTGQDGSGSVSYTGGAGKLDYTMNQGGQEAMTAASVNGVDPVKLGKMSVDQKTHASASNIAHSSGWEKMWGEATKTGNSDTTNRGFMDQHTSAVNSSLNRNINEGSGWASDATSQEKAAVQGAISAGAKFIIGASGNEGVEAVYMDGTKRQMNLSEQTATSLGKSINRAETDSLANIISNTQGREWVSGLAQRVGDTNTSSSLDEIRNIDRDQVSYGVNTMAAVVRNHAQVKFGGDTPEHHQMAVNDINNMVTQHGASGVKAFEDEVKGFLSGQGYWGGHVGSGQMQAQRHPDIKGEVEQRTGSVHIGNQPRHEYLNGQSGVDVSDVPGDQAIQDRGDAIRRGNLEAVGKSQTEGAGSKLKRAEEKAVGMIDDRAGTAKKDFIEKSPLDKPLGNVPPPGSYGNQGVYKD